MNSGAQVDTGRLFDVRPKLGSEQLPVQVEFRSSQLRPMPAWLRWLVDVGRSWKIGDRRRISLLSMPCDSPAAGFVALGVVIGDLTDPRASDVEGHFDALVRYARQYLGFCRSCEMRCQPRQRRCGYAVEATGKLRHVSGTLVGPIVDIEEGAIPLIRLKRGSGTVSLHPPAGVSYYVQHAPPIVARVQDSLDPTPYEALAGGMLPEGGNLGRTYSGACLAGRATGDAATRDLYKSVKLYAGERVHSVADLLAINGWGASGVSRMTYFNTRNGRFDRPSSFNRIVIADGDAALERVLATREFDRSDVIAIVHRTTRDDAARALGERLATMRQWYETDVTELVAGGGSPRGIAVQVLKQRG